MDTGFELSFVFVFLVWDASVFFFDAEVTDGFFDSTVVGFATTSPPNENHKDKVRNIFTKNTKVDRFHLVLKRKQDIFSRENGVRVYRFEYVCKREIGMVLTTSNL
ncbi:hypothetical protein EHQ46_01555 [Leptospira yanagawae]|uniref:Uncharacterized protein n=1 Tax=Leptospira yanagawae TaxID=293069 RepID=A0ABY2M441_9LEPT|nr:hypothetical protein [Leptospira yanagawae]TGL23842.1 hypothetical protein EHQ46_01555 [Leptospira yanagawae]